MEKNWIGKLNIELADNKLSVIKYIYRNTPTNTVPVLTRMVQFCENMLWSLSVRCTTMSNRAIPSELFPMPFGPYMMALLTTPFYEYTKSDVDELMWEKLSINDRVVINYDFFDPTQR